MLVKARNTVRCPVCGLQTSDKICPFSMSGDNNGKGPLEHKTYNGVYTGPEKNPYWAEVEGKIGLRLGWTQSELKTIFDRAKNVANSSATLIGTPTNPAASINRVFLTPQHLWGLTKEEIFALCIIYLYHGKEFPKSQSSIEKAYQIFPLYNVMNDQLQVKVINSFAFMRNVYTVSTDADSAYKDFRTGICRLLMRWMIPEYFIDFRGGTAGPSAPVSVQNAERMYNLLRIKPRFPQYASITGFPDIKLSDTIRYKEYRKLKASYGVQGFEYMFSQLYYHEMPNQIEPALQKRIYSDIMWLMTEYDEFDVFGFPGFLFLPEDRLLRLTYLFGIASVRAMRSENAGFLFLEKHKILINAVSPFVKKITNDIWHASEHDLWIKEYIINNDIIRQEYFSAHKRLPEWRIERNRFEELYRRICGYDGPPITKSIVSGVDITPEEVRSLQGGFDYTKTPPEQIPMQNFNRAVSLIADFIRDPSPLPFNIQPRYGLVLCEHCKEISYAYSQSDSYMVTGCFDRISPDTGMPDATSNKPVNIITKYRCPSCGEEGCREIKVILDMHCERCNAEGSMTRYGFTQISEEGFEFGGIEYTVDCSNCGETGSHSELIDNEYRELLFDGEQGDIVNLGKVGRGRLGHGEPLFKVVSKTDITEMKTVEHPYNLKSHLEIDKSSTTGKVPCIYEMDEQIDSVIDTALDKCCQEMPSSWERDDGPPPQSTVSRIDPTSLEHITREVETLKEDDGTITKRYECDNHKSTILAVIRNLNIDPSLNPPRIQRGSIYLDSIYKQDTIYSIDDTSAQISDNRSDATKQISNIPLSIGNNKGIAQTNAELLASMRYPRRLTEPDTPIAEISPGDSIPLDPDTGQQMPHVTYDPNDRLAYNVRDFYSFDRKESEIVAPTIDCHLICSNWQMQDLIKSTMPFERLPDTFRQSFQKKRIRKWQISRSVSHLIPAKSMPFIPTVTPKEKIKLKKGKIREKHYRSLVVVHIDRSGSMSSSVKDIHCPYIQDRVTCQRCGPYGYSWSGGRCMKNLRADDVARRILVAVVKDCQTRGDKVMVYGYDGSVWPIQSTPSDEYEKLITTALYDSRLSANGSTNLPQSLIQMLSDLESAVDIDRVITIVITDGDIGIYSLMPPLSKILKEYGPVSMYQVEEGEAESFKEEEREIKTDLENNYEWSPAKDNKLRMQAVKITDGGLELISDLTEVLNEELAD